jgi:fibronectin type 3 domain-containing protein
MLKIIKYIALAVAMAVTAAHAATNPILWDINAASGGTDAESPWDFINAGVTEDITSGTVDVITGSSDIMWNAANDLSLDNLNNVGGTYNWGSAAGAIMGDGCNGNNMGTAEMQFSGLTNYLSASTDYKLYIWAHGDGDTQNATITFDGVSKTTPTLRPDANSATNFVVVFNFTTDAVVSNTLDFTWVKQANKYTGLNAIAIVEDDGSIPTAVDVPPTAPAAMYTVISNMAVDVKWTASTTGTDPITYNVKRSLDSGSGYVTIGSTTNTVYVDTTVETNETYYYVVNATNAFGESENTDEATGVGLQYDIIGPDTSNGETLEKDNLFDNDITTYVDNPTKPSWAGLDYGTNNALQIMSIEYTLRGDNGGTWSAAISTSTNATFEGANSADFSDAVVLHTIPTTVANYPEVNTATVTDINSYRYVRALSRSDKGMYYLAEVDFITENDVTANGTPVEWLDGYYDVSGANPSNFADYAAADISDTDGDGLLAWQEYDLGGDPTDASSPAGVSSLYAWPTAPLTNTVYWDASDLADTGSGGGYVVYRSTNDSTYAPLAMVTATEYTDSDVTAGVTYYYKASVTNAAYAHETVLSDSEFAVASQYQIIGAMANSGANKYQWFYELFDGDTATFMDDNASGSYGGLDYGEGNPRLIRAIRYQLRNWSGAYQNATNAVFWGSNTEPDMADFASNSTNGTWTQLAVVPVENTSNSQTYELESEEKGTAFRYVFLTRHDGSRLISFAETDYLTDLDVTSKGTDLEWLDSYYDIPGTNSGVYFADYFDADYSDTDGDGFQAWAEYDLGSDPTDPNDPAGPENLYAWPEAALENTVHWDTSDLADTEDGGGYVVYRSTDDSTYVEVDYVSTNVYTDTDVTDGVTYYYKVSIYNDGFGAETGLSDSEMAVANQYDIFGVMNNGADKTSWFYELFDKNLDTFCDDNAQDGYAGLDYGAGNAQVISHAAFRLRGGDFGYIAKTAVIDGVTNDVYQSQARVLGNTFEGSNDGTNWTVLATITNIYEMVAWNLVEITDATAYRYVRYHAAGDFNNYCMADVEFLKSGEGFTTNGTPLLWLDGYYDVDADFGGDYDAAAASDTDLDGLTAAEEYQQGSDPTDSNDPTAQEFSILGAAPQATGDGIIISWESSAVKTYSVWTNAALTDTNGWGTAQTGIAGGDGSTSYTGTVSEASLFYKVSTP